MLDAGSIAKLAETLAPSFPNSEDAVPLIRKWFEQNGYDLFNVGGSNVTETRQPFSAEQAKQFLADMVDAGLKVTNLSEAIDRVEKLVDDPEMGQDEFGAKVYNWCFDPDSPRRRLASDSAHTYSARTRTSRTSPTAAEVSRFERDFPEVAKIPIHYWEK